MNLRRSPPPRRLSLLFLVPLDRVQVPLRHGQQGAPGGRTAALGADCGEGAGGDGADGHVSLVADGAVGAGGAVVTVLVPANSY